MAKKITPSKSGGKVDLVVLGSIGLDDVKTPFGRVKSALGGSAIYSAVAASCFAKPGIIGIVGNDFPSKDLKMLEERKINTSGIEKNGKTFRWEGLYEFNMNEAQTLKTELNSMANYNPSVPEDYTKTKFLFLGNFDPGAQEKVAKTCPGAFIVLDTMNFWIENKRRQLERTMNLADVVVLNDAEAREFCKEVNLVKAAHKILKIGPKYVIIKKGEHGALLFSKNNHFSAPGYPLDSLKDPTGAGDSFAGALTGYLAQANKTDEKTMRKAVIFGSVIASFCTEDFSINKVIKLNKKLIKERYAIFQEIRKF